MNFFSFRNFSFLPLRLLVGTLAALTFSVMAGNLLKNGAQTDLRMTGNAWIKIKHNSFFIVSAFTEIFEILV